jgi:hypothetical protein
VDSLWLAGKASDYQRYNLSEQGAGVGVSFAF